MAAHGEAPTDGGPASDIFVVHPLPIRPFGLVRMRKCARLSPVLNSLHRASGKLRESWRREKPPQRSRARGFSFVEETHWSPERGLRRGTRPRLWQREPVANAAKFCDCFAPPP